MLIRNPFIFSGITGVSLLCSILSAGAAPRSQLQQDVEGYAVATCLGEQPSPYLKDQADGWGSIIIQRGYGSVEDWQPLTGAVRSVLKKWPVAVIRVEDGKNGASARQMPVFFCSEIIDQPGVSKAISETMDKMKPAYEGR